MTNSRKSYLFAGLAVFFWSTIATAFKLALIEMTPVQLVAIASVTSTLVLAVILITEGSFKKLISSSLTDLGRSMLMGLINPFIYYLILLKAYTLLPAQVAQPLNMIWPIVLVFLSVPLLKQKIPARSFIALIVSLFGVYIISTQGHLFSHGETSIAGVLLATGSSIFWALYFILNLKDRRKEGVKLFMNFLFASLYILILLVLSGETLKISLKGLSAGVYVGLFEMGITFFFWLKALSLTDRSDRISNLVFLAPFLSLIFIHYILDEKIHYTTIAGLTLIVASILYQNFQKAGSMNLQIKN